MYLFIFLTEFDPEDPEAQKAATKIQAVFRGHKTRKEMKTGDAKPEEETQNFEEEFSPDDKGKSFINIYYLHS